MLATKGDVTDRSIEELCMAVDALQYDAHDDISKVRRSEEAQELTRRGLKALPCIVWRLRKAIAEGVARNGPFPWECYAIIIELIVHRNPDARDRAAQSGVTWSQDWSATDEWIALAEAAAPPDVAQ